MSEQTEGAKVAAKERDGCVTDEKSMDKNRPIGGADQRMQEELEQLAFLQQMRDISRTRELTRAQSEVVALAFCKYNLLMRGPANTGKRWIARRAGDLIGLRRFNGSKVDTVEIMSKWFTITSGGQIIIDEAALPVAMDQIRRATVLIIENVPCHPQAAAAFFAHLDFICKVERCKSTKLITNAKFTNSLANLTSSLPSQTCNSTSSEPFGGIQIIATQNDSVESTGFSSPPQPVPNVSIATTPQVFWSEPPPISAPSGAVQISQNNQDIKCGKAECANAAAAAAAIAHGPAVTRPMPRQLGLLVTTAALAISNPHDAVLVVNFR